MDIENPIKGDVRYQPLNWEVLEARSWDGAPYSATFRMGKNGNYTLTVTYNQQQFDGSNWVNTGTQDTKQVNFNCKCCTESDSDTGCRQNRCKSEECSKDRG